MWIDRAVEFSFELIFFLPNISGAILSICILSSIFNRSLWKLSSKIIDLDILSFCRSWLIGIFLVFLSTKVVEASALVISLCSSVSQDRRAAWFVWSVVTVDGGLPSVGKNLDMRLNCSAVD